eukprot:6213694-Pleurochrysis_carterae.AAC.2
MQAFVDDSQHFEMHRLLVNAVLNALVLIVSLSWQDAISATIDVLFQDSKSSVIAQLTRAICVTAVVTLFVYILYSVSEFFTTKSSSKKSSQDTRPKKIISVLG